MKEISETVSSDLINMQRLEILSDDECMESEKFIPEEFYREWINCQTKYTIKILSLILMDTFREQFGLTDIAAATEAEKVVGTVKEAYVLGIQSFMKMRASLKRH